MKTPITPFAPDETTEETDQRLIARALAGGQSALESLIERHQPWIFNLAFRMVLVREDAEDATQEVLIKAITKLTSYDPGKGAFRTWLYRIATNHVINISHYSITVTRFSLSTCPCRLVGMPPII